MIYHAPNYEGDQAVANYINAATRHCRIGKVRLKAGVPWADEGVPPFKYDKPQGWVFKSPSPTPWWMQGPWCNGSTSGVTSAKAERQTRS